MIEEGSKGDIGQTVETNSLHHLIKVDLCMEKNRGETRRGNFREETKEISATIIGLTGVGVGQEMGSLRKL